MRANLNRFVFPNPLEQDGGGVWHRLHSEREDICEALLKEPGPSHGISIADAMSKEQAMKAESYHRGLLQTRLRKVDDALDRLLAGSFGNCSKCGNWIEDTKLDFDPAIALCLGCWVRMQTEH
jgi:RNA polymerase-binding transcription factor DksA